MDNKSSELSASSEKKLATTELQSDSYTDPIALRKPKRFKAASVSEFPSGSGSSSTRLKSKTVLKKVINETCENLNVSCEAEVELIPGKNMTSVDEKLAGVTDGAEFHEVNIQVQIRDRNLPENRSELDMVEAVEVEPVSITLPEEDDDFVCASEDVVMGSVIRPSNVGTKKIPGRKITAIRHFPPNTGTKISKSGETVEVAISMEERDLATEKSDSGDHLGQSLAKSMPPEVSEPLELDKLNFKVPKLIRKYTGKRKAMPSPLELSKELNGDYGKESRRKNSETTVISDKENLAQKPQLSDVGIRPSRPTGPSSGDSARFKVKETLRLFYGACRKLLREEEARPKQRNGRHFMVYVEASKIVKSQGKCLNTGARIIGSVPGVESGDEFQYRTELNILGVHRPFQAGIDYTKDESGDVVATSIVSSGGYDDNLDNSDVLIYTGQGGNVIKKGKNNNEPKDQELVRGNLALVNSKEKQNPVRVTRGKKASPLGSSVEAKNYVYDGLYLVEDFWKEIGSHGKLVFRFRLRRIPGQPELSWKVLKKSKESKSREGLCDADISKGKERLPICAVNEIDDGKPPEFTYTVNMIYPDWCKPIPPKGCGCKKRCTESKTCACVERNGGELPYNHDGAIVIAKPLVYECGPLCKCPPSCYLRVAQSGIRFQLEIFKTESRGWGVRSLNSIPSGSFICEYAGELLEDNEAERLTGKDEYLFDIGKDHETTGFTIDAARKGNIGRFINHSCSPNLYAQDVLYDHDETRMPHVMFFAMDNIPPLVELSYFYNYTIDQVLDADGNIRKKSCYCGSSDCTGRMY